MKRVLLCAAAVALSQIATAPNASADEITLGTAGAFAVLGASTVTNTGATTLNGNLGVYPGTSITGLGTITLTGTVHATDGVASTAQADATIAYNAMASALSTSNLTGQDLGSVGTLNAGVYTFTSSAQLTGHLTLDFQGLSNRDIIFQIGSTLTTASGSSVSIINLGSNDNVYWQVGSSATLGTSTSFMGDIIALASVTMTTTAKDSCGSVIALTAAVTLDTNTISNTCAIVDSSGTTIGTLGGTVTGTTTENQAVPEPGTFLLLGTGIAGLVARRRRWALGRQLDIALKA